jgi:hypothetical protein
MGKRSVAAHLRIRTPSNIRAGAFQWSLRRLMLVPLAVAIGLAMFRWWGPVGAAGYLLGLVAAGSVTSPRFGILVALGFYLASYACLARIDPAGRCYHDDYSQMAASYRVCDRYCQVLFRPVELIDRELRPEYWHFSCVF